MLMLGKSSGFITATVLCAASIGSAIASPMAYTDYTAFMTATGSYTSVATLNFDALSVGAFALGSAFNGVTFTGHDDTAGQLAVATDYATTSGVNYLGVDNGSDMLNGGTDNFSLSFATSNAIGLFIITNETPGETLFNGDIQLFAGGVTAMLDTDTPYKYLRDDSAVFFLGLTSDTAFTSAALTNATVDFFYNIDDITLTAAPVVPPPPNPAPAPNPILAGVLG
ncbi:hypothetical protein [Chromatium okenii]|uniref:hypothetical protein n=1 Tax=Chromatium okenii TaxID=61644 RepID=UPI0026F0A67B|nr:hypothetical protein [Chromatium okenii]MBV5310171.1 hypothetical protein [Chromatium okenii]